MYRSSSEADSKGDTSSLGSVGSGVGGGDLSRTSSGAGAGAGARVGPSFSLARTSTMHAITDKEETFKREQQWLHKDRELRAELALAHEANSFLNDEVTKLKEAIKVGLKVPLPPPINTQITSMDKSSLEKDKHISDLKKQLLNAQQRAAQAENKLLTIKDRDTDEISAAGGGLRSSSAASRPEMLPPSDLYPQMGSKKSSPTHRTDTRKLWSGHHASMSRSSTRESNVSGVTAGTEDPTPHPLNRLDSTLTSGTINIERDLMQELTVSKMQVVSLQKLLQEAHADGDKARSTLQTMGDNFKKLEREMRNVLEDNRHLKAQADRYQKERAMMQMPMQRAGSVHSQSENSIATSIDGESPPAKDSVSGYSTLGRDLRQAMNDASIAFSGGNDVRTSGVGSVNMSGSGVRRSQGSGGIGKGSSMYGQGSQSDSEDGDGDGAVHAGRGSEGGRAREEVDALTEALNESQKMQDDFKQRLYKAESRCAALEIQIQSMPASLQIAVAEKRVLEAKLEKAVDAHDAQMSYHRDEAQKTKDELEAFLSIQATEKAKLRDKVQQQAQTIHQLTHHLHSLQAAQASPEPPEGLIPPAPWDPTGLPQQSMEKPISSQHAALEADVSIQLPPHLQSLLHTSVSERFPAPFPRDPNLSVEPKVVLPYSIPADTRLSVSIDSTAKATQTTMNQVHSKPPQNTAAVETAELAASIKQQQAVGTPQRIAPKTFTPKENPVISPTSERLARMNKSLEDRRNAYDSYKEMTAQHYESPAYRMKQSPLHRPATAGGGYPKAAARYDTFTSSPSVHTTSNDASGAAREPARRFVRDIPVMPLSLGPSSTRSPSTHAQRSQPTDSRQSTLVGMAPRPPQAGLLTMPMPMPVPTEDALERTQSLWVQEGSRPPREMRLPSSRPPMAIDSSLDTASSLQMVASPRSAGMRN